MNRITIVKLALTQLGKPYIFGADEKDKIKIDDPNPPAFDCSFLIEWCYWNASNLAIPRNSQDQFNFCKPTDTPLPADLGFFADKDNHVYHVGLVIDDNKIIEARGYQPESNFETGKVIIRPMIVWNGYTNPYTGHHFAGWRVHPQLMT